MKKWMYLIFPGVMLGIFLVFYMSHAKEVHAKEQRIKMETAKKQADEVARKKAAEAKAREDATKRQAEREAEEKAKQAEKEAKQLADDNRVKAQTEEYLAKGKAAAKEVTEKEAELDRLRKEKDKTSREAFDIAKQVELTRVARRNAELEIQRMTEMIHRRASESSLVRPPVIATPAPAK
ncbi:MAG: hypothetical protein Q8N18_07530 [Opitutaceae bacterium]|nr:hypothetical protein [Opitutaceae bacterium]